MAAIDDAINSLSEDELDLLNSDPEMLAAFKAKYSGAPAKQPGMIARLSMPPQPTSVGEAASETVGAVHDIGNMTKAGYAGIADIVAGNGLKKSVENIKHVENDEDTTSGASVIGEALGAQFTPGMIAAQATLGKLAELVGPAVASLLKGWGEKAALNAVGMIKSIASTLNVSLPDIAKFLVTPIEIGGKEFAPIVRATSDTSTMLSDAEAIQQAAGRQIGAIANTMDDAISSAIARMEENASAPPVEKGMTRLFRVEPKDLGDQGNWLLKHLSPEQGQTFLNERGRLFTDDLAHLADYGHGEPTHTTFYVDLPQKVAEQIKRPNLGSGTGMMEYLLPKEVVAAKKVLGGDVLTPNKEAIINLKAMMPAIEELKEKAVGGLEDVEPAVMQKFDGILKSIQKFVTKQESGPMATSFSDLSSLKTKLGGLTNFKSQTENNLAMQQAYGVLAQTLKDAAEKIGGDVGREYANANAVYHQVTAVINALQGKETKFILKDLFAPGAGAFLGTFIGGLPGMATGAAAGAVGKTYGYQAIARGLNATSPLVAKGLELTAEGVPIAARAIYDGLTLGRNDSGQ